MVAVDPQRITPLGYHLEHRFMIRLVSRDTAIPVVTRRFFWTTNLTDSWCEITYFFDEGWDICRDKLYIH